MSPRLFLITVLTVGILPNSQAQDNTPSPSKALLLPDRVFHSINKNSSEAEEKITRQTVKYLQKLNKQEEKIKARLNRVDSLAAKTIASGISAYQKWEQDIKNPFSEAGKKVNTYVPLLDSLTTSLQFIRQVKIPGQEQLTEINKSLAQVSSLQGKLDQVGQLENFIKERRQLIGEQLQKFGMIKEMKKFREEFYYFQTQFQEYKNILNKPDKIISTTLAVMNKMPAFHDFFLQNSMLSSMFNLPGNPTANLAGSLSGLQTVSQVTSLIGQQGSSSVMGGQASLQQGLQGAQGQMNQWKNKLLKMAGSSSDADMPDNFKPNTTKTKTLLQRLEFGTDFQTQRATNYYPVSSDLGVSVGYRINDKSIIGLGLSYKIGWGSDWNHMRISNLGAGLRSFIDWKIKGSFYISGGYEQNYRTSFTNFRQLQYHSNWQQSGLIGISKSIATKSGLFKKTSVKLLWDFLSYQQMPRTQPVIFRIGYNF